MRAEDAGQAGEAAGTKWEGADWHIMLVFFVQAFAAGAFLTRIPEIQIALGVDEAALGLAFLGQPLGALVVTPFASVIVERIGTRRSMLVGLPVLAVEIWLVAVVPSIEIVFFLLAANGGTFAVSNLAMNVEADRIEAVSGRRLMNTCHGFASMGLLCTSVAGVAARALFLSYSLHLFATAAVVTLLAFLLIWPMRMAPPRPHAGREYRHRFVVRPTGMTFLLVGVAISAFLIEGTARSWSAIYMRESFEVPGWIEALSLVAFFVAMAIGRLTGDRLTSAMGPVVVGRISLMLALAGLVVIVVAPHYGVALAGFAILGLGAAAIYPLTLSAAARLGDRPASENVSSVTMIGSIAVLGAPALLGYVATEWGLRATFAVIVPALLVSLALTSHLDRRS